jgi:hypothetical protein
MGVALSHFSTADELKLRNITTHTSFFYCLKIMVTSLPLDVTVKNIYIFPTRYTYMFIILLTINICYSLNRITDLVSKSHRQRVYFYVGDEMCMCVCVCVYMYIYDLSSL